MIKEIISDRRSLLKWAVLVFGLSGLCVYYLYLVTRTEWTVVAPEFNGMTFASQWAHLAKGQWNVDTTVTYELYPREGKYYIYFGILPALVRGALTVFYDISLSIPRLNLLLAGVILAIVNILTAVQLSLHKGSTSRYFGPLLVLLLFGSPVIYFLTPANPYHEAIMWSLATSALFNLFFIRFAMSPMSNTMGRLIGLGFLAILPLHSRVSVGLAPFLTLGIVGTLLALRYLRKTRQDFLTFLPLLSLRKLILVAGIWILCGSTQLLVSYEKFRDPFAGQRLGQYLYFMNKDGSPNERGKAYAKYGAWRWDNFVPMVEYYFVPQSYNFSSHWPFLVTSNTLDSYEFSEHLDNLEEHMPLTLTCPLMFFLTFCYFKNRRSKPLFDVLILSYLVPGFILLFMWAACLRYCADFLPFLTLGTFWGFYILKEKESPLLKDSRFMACFVIVLLYSIFAVHSTCLMYLLTNQTVPDESKLHLYNLFLKPFI